MECRGALDAVHINAGKIQTSLTIKRSLDAEYTYLQGVAIKRTVIQRSTLWVLDGLTQGAHGVVKRQMGPIKFFLDLHLP